MGPKNSRGQSTIEILTLMLLFAGLILFAMEFSSLGRGIFLHTQLSSERGDLQ